MGYICHHAIVVTSWDERIIEQAHDRAREIFPEVSAILASAVNGYRSFFIPPDGSKEGWGDSAVGSDRRTMFVNYLMAQAYNDGSSPLGLGRGSVW